MMRIVHLCISLFLSTVCWAQDFTISGHIRAGLSGEDLIGANIYNAKSQSGTVSNFYGFYSLTMPQDSIDITFSYVGYQSVNKTFFLNNDLKFDILLFPIINMGVAEVTSENGDRIEERSQMSAMEIPMSKVNNLPVLLGEKDVLKMLQLLPGIQSGSEGSSGFYVRGGGPDQNLILLDGVPIYNASHLFGFFSIFNPDAIRKAQIFKGGFPARYGGRTSSVLDIRMKEGNKNKLVGEGSIGIISSKLTLEGPLKKKKGSFLISGRRTYIDFISRALIRSNSNGEQTGGYYFYDLNGKLNYQLDEKNRIYFSAYMGNDRAFSRFDQGQFINPDQKEVVSLEWGNIIGVARWNREISNKLFANTTLTYSRYRFATGFEIQDGGFNSYFRYFSGIQDFAAKLDFDFVPTPDHYVKFGTGIIHHKFTPGVNEFKNANPNEIGNFSFGSDIVNALEGYGYFEDDWKVNHRLKINYGLHLSGFLVNSEPYGSIQPRISGRYLLNDVISAKASYSSMAQYLHLLTNLGVGVPTDLWVPVTENVKPQFSNQWAVGFAATLKKGIEISIEAYDKRMRNVIDYKDGASFIGNSKDWQSKVEVGNGTSRGLELLIEKKTGKFSGWVGYTLSWTTRQFDNLNGGNPYPYRFDRRHDLSIAITYKFNDNVDVGLVYVYGTGNAVTLPTASYQGSDPLSQILNSSFQPNNTMEYVGERNSYRAPAYHRLDLGVNFHKQMKKHERTWSFGVYNIYNRQNPFFLYFSTNDKGERALFQTSLFPLIPSANWSFKF